MKLNPKLFIITGLISIVLLTVFSGIYTIYSQPKRNGEIKLTGLKDKVTIYFDSHGRPHIYTKNLHDLVFTQGYLTAQDRLFQLDITRRAAKGQLSEVVGKKGLLRDKFAIDLGLLRSAHEELKNYNKETMELLYAYSDGITAYIEKHKHNLPIEFRVLNYKPKPWKPIDTVIIYKQIAEIIDSSWQIDLMRYEVYKKIPVERANELFEQNFPGNPIINYNAKKYLVFDEYTLKKPTLIQRWKTIKEQVVFKELIEGPYFKIKKKIIEAADFLRNGSDRWEGFNWGSNCWVIAKAKNNAPILANDPHMELATPSFWYPIHLVGGGINAVGLSIPGIPGILIGHNGKIAWGITSLSADVQDVFIGEFKDSNSLLYKSGDNWEKAKVIKTKIKIKNRKEPLIHKTIITSCGPLLDREDKKAIALKWSSLESDDHDSVAGIWNLTKAKKLGRL